MKVPLTPMGYVAIVATIGLVVFALSARRLSSMEASPSLRSPCDDYLAGNDGARFPGLTKGRGDQCAFDCADPGNCLWDGERWRRPFIFSNGERLDFGRASDDYIVSTKGALPSPIICRETAVWKTGRIRSIEGDGGVTFYGVGFCDDLAVWR